MTVRMSGLADAVLSRQTATAFAASLLEAHSQAQARHAEGLRIAALIESLPSESVEHHLRRTRPFEVYFD